MLASQLRARLAAASICALALGCSRDLDVPQQPGPPGDLSFEPDAGFSGDSLVITGNSLGDPTVSRVFVGDQPAPIVEGAKGGTSLRVLVPDNAGDRVSIQTPEGRTVADAKFGWLGPGHPRNIAVRTVFDLGPHMSQVSSVGNQILMLDTLHDLAVEVDPATGDIGAPAPMPHDSLLILGQPAAPWTFTSGSLDLTDPLDQGPALAQLDLSGGSTWRTVPLTGVKPYSADGVTVTNRAVLYASRSDGGLALAVPAGGAKVALARLNGSSDPTQSQVSLPVTPDSHGIVAIAGTAFWGDAAVIGFANSQPFRIDLGSAGAADVATAGMPAATPEAVAAPGFPMAVEPVSRRLAYVRADGDIGFVTWDVAAGAAPTISADILRTFANEADLLAWTPAGDALFVYDSTRSLLDVYDAATLMAVNSLTLPNVTSLEPVRAGAAKGNVLAGLAQSGAFLLSPGGVELTQFAVRPGVPGEAAMALAPSGRLVVPTFFGPVAVDPDKLTSQTPVDYFEPVGVASGEGGLVAWGLGTLRTPTPGGGYQIFAGIPDGQLVKSAAASPDGKWIAIATCPPSTSDLTRCGKSGSYSLALLPKDGSTLAAPPPLAWTSPPSLSVHGVVLYAQGQLFAVHAGPGHLRLSRFRPGTLAEEAGVDLPGDTIRGLWWSRALSGVFTAVSSTTFSTGYLWPLSGMTDPLTVNLARPMQNPISLSADGRMMISSSSGDLGRSPSIDTAILNIDPTAGVLHYLLGGHADVPGGRPQSALPSPDGARFYLAVPGADLFVTIE